MTLALLLVASYLIGSIPMGYMLAKRVRGIDLRTVGSGNIGATNALRAAGPALGATVLLLDLLKGVVPTLLPRWIAHDPTVTAALAVGLAAVIGHTFPCFLGFKGGKGVATTLGALLGSMPAVCGIVVGIWLVAFLLSRYVSVGSLASALAIPIAQWAMRQPPSAIGLGIAFAALIMLRHRPNIERLLRGEEHRAWSPKFSTKSR